MTGRSRTLRRFWALLSPFRGTIFLLFGLALVSAGVQMTQPYLYHFAIDEVALNRSVAPATRLVWLAQVFAAMISLIGISFVASYYNSYRTHALNHIVTARLRHKLLRHMLRLPLHALVTMKTGGAVARLNQDTEKVSQTVHRSIITPGVAIVQVTVGLALVFALNWRLALASVLIIVPLALLTHRTGRRLRPLFTEISKMGNELSARTVEMFGGIRVSRLYGREIAERRTYLRLYHRVIRRNLAVRRKQLGINTFTSLSFAFIQVIIVSLGVYLIIYDLATVGDIFAIVVYSNRIAGPIDQVITSYQQVQEDLGVLDRIFEVFDIEQDKFEHVKTVEAPAKVESVSFEGVGFSYNGNHRKALSDIQLHIPGGTTVALVGKSGAGKSTLTDLLSRFYEPQEGTIRLNGRNVREIELKSYRRLLGLVQQETFLFDGTVRENIAYAVPHASEADVLEAAQRANAHEFIVRLPKCYDTVIGERGVRLSGGQRQRISMARAFLVDPEILILDEATSNLDTENEQMIQQAMKELLKDRTTFIIAHRLSTVTHADTIVVLDEGCIRETGTHTELLAKRGPYYDMIALQHKADRF